MKRFIEGEDRDQSTLFPERLDDYIAEDNPCSQKTHPWLDINILTSIVRVTILLCLASMETYNWLINSSQRWGSLWIGCVFWPTLLGQWTRNSFSSVSLPRERFWDVPVAKIDSPTRQPLCPGRPASAARPHSPLVRGIPRLPHWLDGARMRFAARPLARKRTPAVLNRLAPTGDYWPRASPFHGQQRVISFITLPISHHF